MQNSTTKLWRDLVSSLLSSNTPVVNIIDQVYKAYPKHFKSKDSCGETVKKFIRKIRPSKTKTSANDFDEQIQTQREHLETQVQKKHDKVLAGKMAIADFVIENCKDALRERSPSKALSVLSKMPKRKTGSDELGPNSSTPQTIVLELSDIQAGTLITT